MDKQRLSGILYTQDKITIAYEHIKSGFESVVVVCPGFFNSKNTRWMREAVNLVSGEHDVLIFDFRGHGDSGGRFSWLAREHLDLDAVLNYATSQQYKQIAILAFSLGAAAAVNLVSRREGVKSMVLISCLTKFRKIDFHFWNPKMLSDLKENIDCNWEGKGARMGSLFIPKPKPIKNIGKIKNTAILFIHGDSDWVIKENHSKELYEAARTFKKLEIIKGGLHAERLIQQYPHRLRDLILGWFSNTV